MILAPAADANRSEKKLAPCRPPAEAPAAGLIIWKWNGRALLFSMACCVRGGMCDLCRETLSTISLNLLRNSSAKSEIRDDIRPEWATMWYSVIFHRSRDIPNEWFVCCFGEKERSHCSQQTSSVDTPSHPFTCRRSKNAIDISYASFFDARICWTSKSQPWSTFLTTSASSTWT